MTVVVILSTVPDIQSPLADDEQSRTVTTRTSDPPRGSAARDMDDARIAAALALLFSGNSANRLWARGAQGSVYDEAQTRGFLSEAGFLTRKGRALLARHPWGR